MIRKEGKARWTYTCTSCSVRGIHPDHFRAIEQQQDHERGIAHVGNTIGHVVRAAFAPMLTSLGWGPLQPWQEAILVQAAWEARR